MMQLRPTLLSEAEYGKMKKKERATMKVHVSEISNTMMNEWNYKED